MKIKKKLMMYNIITIILLFALVYTLYTKNNSQKLPEVDGADTDAHTHLMSRALTDALTGGGVPASDAKDLISQLDEANVDKAVIMSLGYWDFPDDSYMSLENDFVAEEIAKYPDRLIGFVGINPLNKYAIDEADRGIDELGMKGIKLQLPSSGIDLRNKTHMESVSKVLDKAREHDVPVMIHISAPPLDSDEVINVFELLGTHPDVRIAIAHSGGLLDWEPETYLVGSRTVPPMINTENFYLDLSAHLEMYKDAPMSKRELIVWRFRKWGIDRVLFSSDYLMLAPAETPAEALDTLSQYPFTQEEIDIITGSENVQNWLNG